MIYICLLAFFTLLLGSCKDKEVLIETVDLNPEETANTCQIVSTTRHNGITYGFNYEGNKIIGMSGFSDFDTFEYDGVELTRAFNSRDDSYDVHFEYNSNGQLMAVIFSGRDSQGRFFSNASTLTYNSKNQISQLLFNWPTFDRVACFLNYDENGNVLNISGEYQGRLQNFLINNSFDDKKSPYKNQKIAKYLLIL